MVRVFLDFQYSHVMVSISDSPGLRILRSSDCENSENSYSFQINYPVLKKAGLQQLLQANSQGNEHQLKVHPKEVLFLVLLIHIFYPCLLRSWVLRSRF